MASKCWVYCPKCQHHGIALIDGAVLDQNHMIIEGSYCCQNCNAVFGLDLTIHYREIK